MTLLDGREIVLSDMREIGQSNRGIYVSDQRYGRVLISWDAFERVDFNPLAAALPTATSHRVARSGVTSRPATAAASPADWSMTSTEETTETLDAPLQGVDYTIHFGLIASIVLSGGEEQDAERATVILHSGEELQLERTGDLGEKNAGLLIFVDGIERPGYVPWIEVERVDFDRP